MKVTATLTAQVMDAIGRLPGIATLDWCDRAAAALAHAHYPCTVALALGQIDAKGFLTTLEVAGIATSTPAATRAPSDEAEEPSADLVRIRETFRPGEWLGWNFTMAGSAPFISTAGQLGLLRRGEGPLARRWAAFEPSEVIVAAIPVGGAAGRVLVVELALKDAARHDTALQQSVLAATIPHLARRLSTAIGSDAIDKREWLTPREEAVLWHLVAGKKVPEIAAELHRSVYTVHDHVKSLHRKLGANNRGQLVARALGHIGPLPTDRSPGVRPIAPKRTPRLTAARQ